LARRPPSKRPAPRALARPNVLVGESLPPPPQQTRSRRTRDALLAAALDGFEQHGFEATTIEAIARKADVATGAFYQHFRTKRQLLLVLVDRLLTELDALGPPEDFTLDPAGAKALVETLVRTGMRVDMKYIGAYRAWQEAALGEPGLAKRQAAIEAWTTQRTAQLLQLVSQAPNARRDLDVQALAHVLNAMFWRLMQTRSGDEESILRTTTDIVTHAIFQD
jgi:AcrR family transcriptional regulator